MATSNDFIPARESDLVTFSGNLSTKISADPTEFALTVEQAAALAVLHGEFVEAYNTANDPLTRSPANITAKNLAKVALIEKIRELAAIVQAAPATTDFQRAELGLTIPKEPTPTPVPGEAPVLEVVSRLGTTVRVKLHDGSGTRRGKPDGVSSAVVFKHVGPTPPVDINEWTLEGNATKTIVDVEFDPMLPVGTIVHLCAFWQNPKGQNGPGCPALTTWLAGGAMEQAA